MNSKRRTKRTNMPLSASILAMAVMLATQEAYIERIIEDGQTDLKFSFAANQQFMLTFEGERLMAASLTLIEGREPSTQAAFRIDAETNVDTIDLFDGLASDDILKVTVVSDAGHNLDDEGVSITLAEVSRQNVLLATVIKELLGAEEESSVNLGPCIESLRTKLAKLYRPQSQQAA